VVSMVSVPAIKKNVLAKKKRQYKYGTFKN